VNRDGDGEMEREKVASEMGLHWMDIDWTRGFLTEEMLFN